MRIIEKEIPYSSRKNRFWSIVPLGDIHLGHPNCHLELLETTIDYIKDNDNCLWIGMGDYGDAIDPKDWRFTFDSIDLRYPTPDLQYRKIRELFKPIADKCIGLLDGNHDLKHWKKHAHNYVDSLAYDLEMPYLTIDSYIRLKFQRKTSKKVKSSTTTINMYAHHGWTSSRTSGGKVNRIEDLAEIFPGLEIYCMGHTHERGSAFPKVQLFVNNSLDILHHEMNFVFTGGFLRGYMDGNASYVEEKAYKPAALGAPIINIELDPGDTSTFSRPKITVNSLHLRKDLFNGAPSLPLEAE